MALGGFARRRMWVQVRRSRVWRCCAEAVAGRVARGERKSECSRGRGCARRSRLGVKARHEPRERRRQSGVGARVGARRVRSLGERQRKRRNAGGALRRRRRRSSRGVRERSRAQEPEAGASRMDEERGGASEATAGGETRHAGGRRGAQAEAAMGRTGASSCSERTEWRSGAAQAQTRRAGSRRGARAETAMGRRGERRCGARGARRMRTMGRRGVGEGARKCDDSQQARWPWNRRRGRAVEVFPRGKGGERAGRWAWGWGVRW